MVTHSAHRCPSHRALRACGSLSGLWQLWDAMLDQINAKVCENGFGDPQYEDGFCSPSYCCALHLIPRSSFILGSQNLLCALGKIILRGSPQQQSRSSLAISSASHFGCGRGWRQRSIGGSLCSDGCGDQTQLLSLEVVFFSCDVTMVSDFASRVGWRVEQNRPWTP